LAACLVLGFLGILVYRANAASISQYFNGTYTPSPTLTPLISSTPTIAPTLTLTPTLTFTPTITLTPTPVPPSNYLLPNERVSSLYPQSPVLGDAYWLIDDTTAILEHPLDSPDQIWQSGTSRDRNAQNEKFIYTVKGNTRAAWFMDVPFDQTGYYQIFVLDTQQFSSQQQNFTIFLDQQAVQAYRGTSQVIFENSGRAADEWISLGVYQANAGQSLIVQAKLGELTEETPFAVDRVLIVRLNEASRQILDLLPTGRTLVSLLDDSEARFLEVVGGTAPTQTQDRGSLFNDVMAWNGSFSSRTLAEPASFPIWVDWTPANRLTAGTYEVQVWVPAQHATIITEYALLGDEKMVERPNPAPVNQKDHPGAWVTLGTWDLPEEAAVSLRMIIAAGMTGDIGVDAVAILRVEQ
jgi:hypothetical protein